MSILTLDKVSKAFGGLTAVSDVSLHVNSKELVGLIGPNGAGKTTLFNLITGVYTPTSGKILLASDGGTTEISGMKPYKISDLGLLEPFKIFASLLIERF